LNVLFDKLLVETDKRPIKYILKNSFYIIY